MLVPDRDEPTTPKRSGHTSAGGTLRSIASFFLDPNNEEPSPAATPPPPADPPVPAGGFYGTMRRIRNFFVAPEGDEEAPAPAAPEPEVANSRSSQRPMNTFGRVRNIFSRNSGPAPTPAAPVQRAPFKPMMKPASRVNYSAANIFATQSQDEGQSSGHADLEMSDV